MIANSILYRLDGITEESKKILLEKEYVTKKDQFDFICEKHGIYRHSIGSHLKGCRCKKCGYELLVEKAAIAKRQDLPQWFLDDLSDNEKEKIKNGTFKRRGPKEFVCKIHGLYIQHFDSHLRGSICPECRKEKDKENRCKKRVLYRENNPFPEEFLMDLEKSPDKDKVLSGKIGTKEHITFVCEEHGLYRQAIDCHMMGQGCPICKLKKQGVSFRKNYRKLKPYTKEFLDSIAYDDEKEKVEKFELGIEDRIHFKCEKHGVFCTSIRSQLKGSSCTLCNIEDMGNRLSISKRKSNPFPQWFIDSLEGSPDKDDILNSIKKTTDKATFFCKKHGYYEQLICSRLNGKRGCQKCANGNHKSDLEDDIYERLCSIIGKEKIVRSDRKTLINPYTNNYLELDIYIPEYNLAVEINGLYWHSYEKLSKKNVHKPHLFHKLKTDLCLEQGIQLIHLFDDDLNRDMDLCFDLIRSKLMLHGLKDDRRRIYARKCAVMFIDKDIARKFFDANHIQGYSNGKNIGLMYEGELVSCMSVKECAKNTSDNGSHILNRFATMRGVNVIGGIEKLMRYAEKELKIKSWISYADLCVSDGSLYERTGWTKVGDVSPDYMYIVDGVREHKFNYRKERFKNDEYLIYDEGLTESELAELNGIEKIYDCGKIKYKKIVTIVKNN